MGELLKQNPAVEAAPLEDELLVVNPETSKFYMLNRTSAFIWTSLEGPADATQVAQRLSENFKGVSIDQATEDVQSALEEMRSLNLIVMAE
jgi:hypothetical protein